MKQMIRITVAFSVLLAASILFGNTATANDPGDFIYTVIDGQATITKYNGPGGDITIPNVLGGSPVTAIGDSAFENYDYIENIVISYGIEHIGKWAFAANHELISVVIPDSVVDIGIGAFGYCSNLKTANLPQNINTISDCLFSDCDNLQNITLPNGLESIGAAAFNSCGSLTDMVIPDNVTSIGREAFAGCFRLTRLIIPDSVTSIGYYAFSFCCGLQEISLPGNLEIIDLYIFNCCENLRSITIPSKVSVFHRAFCGNTLLRKIIFTGDKPQIDSGVFNDIPSGCMICYPIANMASWSGSNYIAYCNASIYLQDGSPVTSEMCFANIVAINRAYINGPVTPSKTGYTFINWFKEPECVNAWDFSKAPITGDISVYAKWEINTYKVHFVSQDVMVVDVPAQYHATIQEPVQPDRTGYTFLGWYRDDGVTKWDFTADTVTGDSTLYAKWAINTYTVTFDSQGGSAVESIKAEYNSQLTGLVTLTRENYAFGGWYKDIDCNDGSAWSAETDRITTDITLYAKWIYDFNYTVTDGKASITGYSGSGSEVEIPAEVEGHPVERVGLKAFIKCTALTLPACITDITMESSSNVACLLNIFIANNNPVYCSIDGVLFSKDKATLVAYPCGRLDTTYAIPSDTAAIGDCAFINDIHLTGMVIPESVTTLGNYAFAGCSGLVSVHFEGDAPVTAYDTSFSGVPAGFTIFYKSSSVGWSGSNWHGCRTEPWTDTVTFDQQYDPSLCVRQTIEHDALLVWQAGPARPGYAFCGWYKEAACINQWNFNADHVNSDITLYAKWGKTYTVEFNSEGGSTVNSAVVLANTPVQKPNDPVYSGFQFCGWCTDTSHRNAWDFSSIVTGNIKLYAIWSPNTYSISFDTQEGSPVPGLQVVYKEAYGSLPQPIRIGYDFKGWFTDKNGAGQHITGDTKMTFSFDHMLYAFWQQSVYTITFRAQGGNAVDNISATYGAAIPTPPAPARSGYVFLGWYKEPSCDNAWDFTLDHVLADTTLYAGWASNIPASLKVLSTTSSSVLLQWDAVPHAEGYEILYATSAGGTYISGGSTTDTKVSCTGLAIAKPYFFKVRACFTKAGVKEYGGYSVIVSAAPLPGTPAVTAVSASYNSIRVTWSAVAGSVKYELYRSTSANGTYKLLTTTTALYYSNTGLATGTVYYYKVKAFQLVKAKKVYGLFSALAKAAATLSAPATIKAARASSTSVKLSWSSVPGRTKYEIWRCDTAGGTFKLVGTTTATTYANARLTTGQTYYYKVRAYHLEGSKKVYGGYTQIVSVRP